MKNFFIFSLVFALGVGIGLVVTPIGIEINRHYLSPVSDQPVQQKNSFARNKSIG